MVLEGLSVVKPWFDLFFVRDFKIYMESYFDWDIINLWIGSHNEHMLQWQMEDVQDVKTHIMAWVMHTMDIVVGFFFWQF
jgi:hypothetical protein